LFLEDKVLAAWYLPERLIVRADQMLDEMCATMGGAEQVTFGRISTGALSDLEKSKTSSRNGNRLRIE
jgi:cell division protease FtsH